MYCQICYVFYEGSICHEVLRAELPGSYILLSHCLLNYRNVTTEVHAVDFKIACVGKIRQIIL